MSTQWSSLLGVSCSSRRRSGGGDFQTALSCSLRVSGLNAGERSSIPPLVDLVHTVGDVKENANGTSELDFVACGFEALGNLEGNDTTTGNQRWHEDREAAFA